MANIFEIYRSDNLIILSGETLLRIQSQVANRILGLDTDKNVVTIEAIKVDASENVTMTQDLTVTGGITAKKLTLVNTDINTDADYRGITSYQNKIAGVTDTNDDFMGMYNAVTYNQAGGVLGVTRGLYNIVVQSDGDVGTAAIAKSVEGEYALCDLNGGKVYGNVRGGYFRVDQEAAHEVTGNIYGLELWMDCDGTTTGTTACLRLRAYTGVDYGIYQLGGTQNYFGSASGFGVTVPTASVHVIQPSASGAMPVLKLHQSDIDDTFIDFIGTSAADGTRSISSDTNEAGACFGKIRVEINGVTKWVRVYDDST